MAVALGLAMTLAMSVQATDRTMSLKPGWRWLVHDGCGFAVPESWRPNADGSQVIGPDGSRLSIRRFHVPSWAIHRSQLKAAFGAVRSVHEDSSRRLWLEFGTGTRTQYYIAVAEGTDACDGLLDVRPAATGVDPTANVIADSIGMTTGPAPTGVK